ncbi:MAG: DUF1232 domain-containing protein [bacterium]|nr:DUF1232 domain-containing protein [bacterium]
MKRGILWALLIATGILIISPVDALPDMLPGGFADDIAYAVIDAVLVTLLATGFGKKKEKEVFEAETDEAVPELVAAVEK